MSYCRLLTFPLFCSQIIIIFSNLASTLPNVVASRECESTWCLPSLPWDTLLGGGSAAVGVFEGIFNGFVKPQLPATTPPTTTPDDDDNNDDGSSDQRAWPNSDMELDVYGLPGGDQNQCQNNLPDLQPGNVSFFFFLYFQIFFWLLSSARGYLFLISGRKIKIKRQTPMPRNVDPLQSKSFGRRAAN